MTPPAKPRPESALTEIVEGAKICLRSIKGGHMVTMRLAAMGLLPGVQAVVLRNAGGPVLLAVKGSRIAVGRGMAQKIRVS